MIKSILTYSFILLYLFTEAQTIKNPEKEFSDLKDYHFEHFHDHYITKKYKNKEEVIDTVYSCDYNKENKIIRERFLNYNSRVDGTTLFFYNKKGRLSKSIFYHQPHSKNNYNVNSINISLYNYNAFDSLLSIEDYSGNRICLSSKIETKDSVAYEPMSKYTDDWRWTYTGDFKYEYDSLKKLIKSYSVITPDIGSKSTSTNFQEFTNTYKYDSLKRVIYESHTVHSMNGYAVDSNSFFNYTLLYKYYPDSLIIINTDSNALEPYVKKKISYDSKGRIIEELETVANSDAPIFLISNKYFYEDNKLVKRERVFDKSPTPEVFNYFYRKE